MADYYRILNLEPSADEAEIKKAFNREMRVWSNRTNAPQMERRQEAERMVQLLEEAEGVLLDATTRAEYDRSQPRAPDRPTGGSRAAAERSPRRETSMPPDRGGDASSLIQEGWQLLIDDRIEEALAVATRASEMEPTNADAWALLGQAKYRSGDVDDAIYEYKRAIKLRPSEASYCGDLGSIYESLERWELALQQFEQAAQIDPKTPMYRAAIGIIYVKTGNLDEAIALLERCVREEPENQGYQQALGYAYVDGMLSSWWKHGDQYYCLSEEQALQARAVLEKARALRFDDAELKGQIAERGKLVESMFERQFKGSWVMVILLGLCYIVPGVLWWWVNRRPTYKINRDLHDIIEHNKADAAVGGELGAYYSALPPGFKWMASTFPRPVVWFAILLLSPFTFLYLVYDNYGPKHLAGFAGAGFLLAIIAGIAANQSPTRTNQTASLAHVDDNKRPPITPVIAENHANNDSKWERPGTKEAAAVDRAISDLDHAYAGLMRQLSAKQQQALRDDQLAWASALDSALIRIVGAPRGGSGYRLDYLEAKLTLIEKRAAFLKDYHGDSQWVSNASLASKPQTFVSTPFPDGPPQPIETAKLETIKPVLPPTLTAGPVVTATKVAPFVNSLGMKFVPVTSTKVLFSIWETRVQDYEKFVQATSRGWNRPPFKQGPTHPAVRVSYFDATAFCAWLTDMEHRAGILLSTARYRLPTDDEWSCAVDLGEEYGNTPKMKDSVVRGYPWGYAWPPPKGAGNYDQSLQVDSFPYTSPVGSFKPNQFGIYDLGGNAYEWVADFYDETHTTRTARGASWADEADQLMSSNRNASNPEERNKSFGFRCVMEPGGLGRDQAPHVFGANLADDFSKLIVGKWQSQKPGEIIQYFADGTYVQSGGARLDRCRWQVVGTQLTYTFADRTTNTKVIVSLNDRELVLRNFDASEVRFTRDIP